MYVYNAQINRWVDGDTVDVDIDLGFGIIFSNQRIRLWGIDAPESRTRDLVEKKLGKAATKFAEEYAPEGTTVKLTTHKTGKFGRILGEIEVDGVNLNKLMIEEGHANEYLG
jgi:micrococcal nuclease